MIKVTDEMIKAYNEYWQQFDEDELLNDQELVDLAGKVALEEAIHVSTQIQDLIAENKRLREALSKLVKLKEHKDNVGKDEYYHNNLLLVWDNAKKALTTTT